MHYKTMVLELLQQRPELHEQLRASRTLLSTMEKHASELKASHEDWQKQLLELRPGSDPIQISSEALELALQELEERLPSGSPPDEDTSLSLDEAMRFLRDHPAAS